MTFLSSASTKILESIFPTKTFFPIKIQDQRDVYRSFSLKTTSWSAGKERMFLIQHLYFVDAFTQMNNSPARLYGYLSLIIVSIAFFNFSGVSITKYMGATTRKVQWKKKQNLIKLKQFSFRCWIPCVRSSYGLPQSCCLSVTTGGICPPSKMNFGSS